MAVVALPVRHGRAPSGDDVLFPAPAGLRGTLAGRHLHVVSRVLNHARSSHSRRRQWKSSVKMLSEGPLRFRPFRAFDESFDN
jgi:hypothetical protein